MMPITMSKFNSQKRSYATPETNPAIPLFTNTRSRRVTALGEGQRKEIVFNSITEAAFHFGVSPGAVANAINNGHRAANRRFCFADQLMENLPIGLLKYRNKVADEDITVRSAAESVIDKYGGSAEEFESAIESLRNALHQARNGAAK